MPKRTDIHSICLIGSGPIVIGQACEFDYAGCQALKVLRDDGFRTVVVNSNPATIMGGVRTGRDALELIACGANHVAIGTILFADPDAPARIREELAQEAMRAGFDTPEAAFSAALAPVAKMAN